MQEKKFDVIVIGAGAAGLMAAWEIVRTGRTVAVLEARDRVGGRTHTITDPAFDMPVELGAEFIHGKLEPTLTLLDKAGIKYYPVGGESWQNKDGKLQEQDDMIEDFSALEKKFGEIKEDISVADFIDRHLQDPGFDELRFTLRNYVEGYYAADAGRASTYALQQELTEGEDEQYRIEGGYVKLFDYITGECTRHGVAFFFSHPVEEVTWSSGTVEIRTANDIFKASKLMITVPMGVLQQEKIRFTPALPDQLEAARRLGFGPVVKTILQFDEPFWERKEYTQQQDLRKAGFIFSQALVPTWWTYRPKRSAMLTGWSAGPHARDLSGRTNIEIRDAAIDSLGRIFSIGEAELRYRLRGWHVANWLDDPYSCGAYSYEVVGGAEAKKVLKQAVEDTLFFAGEGLYEGPEIGTVNAGFVTGRDAAYNLIASFKK